jgi:hypothetical protein
VGKKPKPPNNRVISEDGKVEPRLHETFRIIEPYLKEHGFRYTMKWVGMDEYFDGNRTYITCDKWKKGRVRAVPIEVDGSELRVNVILLRTSGVTLDLHDPDALEKLVGLLKSIRQ